MNKVFKNISWIIICKLIQSVLALVISMITARYLGPSNFGLINYAASITAFAAPIACFGLNGILVQELINNKEDKDKIIGTSLAICCISSILCIMGIISFVSIVNFGEIECIIVCALYSIQLIFNSANTVFSSYYQSEYKSYYISIISLVAYVIVSIYKIYLLATQKNIYWFAISNSVDYFIIFFVSFWTYKKTSNNISCSIEYVKKLMSKGKYYIISGLMITMFSQIDKMMIKIMIGNYDIGLYSAAVSCATMSGFLFTAIIDSIRPTIYEAKKVSEELFEKRLINLYSIIIIISVIQSVIITIFSKNIVNILYGSEYLSSSITLKIIVWYTIFSYIGGVRDIWLLAVNMQKYVIHINFIGAIFNVILNYILIKLYGINGAALASLITQLFVNIILGYLIKDIRRNNTLIFESIRIKNIKELITIVKKAIKH